MVQRIVAYDRSDGIVKRQRAGAEPGRDRPGEPLRGQRSRGDDTRRRQLGDFIAGNGDVGVPAHPLVDFGGKHLAVHHQRGAAGHPGTIGTLEQQAAEQTQLGLEQAVGVAELDGLEGVAADQLRQSTRLMCRRAHCGPHFMEGDLNAAVGQRPGGLRARQSPSHDHGV